MMKKIARCPLFTISIALLVAISALSAALPDRTRSEMENRPLAAFPGLTARAVLSGGWMRDAETYVDDQFFARDEWMLLKALSDAALLRTERNGVLTGRDGSLFARAEALSAATALDNMASLEKIARKTGVPVTLMLVPPSGAVYAERLPAFAQEQDAVALLSALYAEAKLVRCADALPPLLAAKDGAALFYRTDHHWTAEGARVGLAALETSFGWKASAAPTETLTRDGFYGSLFARAPSPLIRPDTLSFDTADGVTLFVGGEPMDGLYDARQMQKRDKYAALLYGNHARVTLDNPSGSGVLLVLKDSFANALLPGLAAHYQKVEAIDLRYFAGDLFSTIQETEAEAILCLYGLDTFATDRNLSLFTASAD